ncbi:hypothetical protein GCK32_006601 [Trichostrongylus colubriformis]|uniref:Uncharacterized protein n=1 Tax=Trichostrongylus colubriformis TaxID=6319 RepID=A0AAN8FSN1_TRICO
MQGLLDALDEHITAEERINEVVDNTATNETHSNPRRSLKAKGQTSPCIFCQIVARTWIELEIIWKEGRVAFARRLWLKTDRKRERRIRTSSEAEEVFGKKERACTRREAEKLFEKEASTYYTY